VVTAVLLFLALCPLRALLSFPTRRSSDLGGDDDLRAAADQGPRDGLADAQPATGHDRDLAFEFPGAHVRFTHTLLVSVYCSSTRSEEHTSELQSRSDLVCRLLLEKKKKNN